MKITIVLGAFFPVPPSMGGAVEKVWFALAPEFVRRGHEVVMISRKISQLPERETIESVEHLRVRGFDTPKSSLWLKACDFFYSLGVRRVLPSANIVVTNAFWLPLLLRNTKRNRIYVHVARYPKGQMRFYRHCARLQAPSHAIADAILAEVPALREKVVVIPYPRPKRADDALPEFATRARTILYVGRVHPEKGVDLLVRAFAGMPPKIRERWKLVIIGPWESKLGGGGEAYWQELHSLANESSDCVELRGPIFASDRLAEEFRSAQLFVYPSLAERGETFGLAALEAMTYGCATVVSDLGCFRDFVRDGETGFVFNHRAADAAQALGMKIAEIVSNEALLARVAEAGCRKTDEFALPRIAEQFLDDFAKICGRVTPTR